MRKYMIQMMRTQMVRLSPDLQSRHIVEWSTLQLKTGTRTIIRMKTHGRSPMEVKAAVCTLLIPVFRRTRQLTRRTRAFWFNLDVFHEHSDYDEMAHGDISDHEWR